MAGIQVASIQREMCNPRFNGVVGSLMNGYIVIGGTLGGQTGPLGRGFGADFVWDLWNEQFAVFKYPTASVNSNRLAGAGASIYVGFGTGRFNSVISAWSGTFYSNQYSLDVSAWKLLGISAQIQGFTSPDGSMIGGLAGIGGSASVPGSLRQLLKLPVGVSANVGGGVWSTFDGATKAASRGRPLGRQNGGVFVNLRNGGVLGVSSHILSVLGPNPLTLGLAGYAAGVSMVKYGQSGQCVVAS